MKYIAHLTRLSKLLPALFLILTEPTFADVYYENTPPTPAVATTSAPANTSSLPSSLPVTPSPASLAQQNITELSHFLVHYRDDITHPWPQINLSGILKLHMRGKAVVALKQRLIDTGDLATDTPLTATFDQPLQKAVAYYQHRMGLNPDGVVGAATLRELNVSPTARAQQIAVNIARWQTLLPKLGYRFVMVNVPDFRLYVYEGGHKLFDMKTVVGRPTRQTPEIDSRITRLVLDPYWNVPQMIANRDIVPKVMDDPSYLDDMHIHILSNNGSDANEVSQDEINWDNVADNGFPYRFRQDPGIDNALGLVKFEFQNSNSIYLHDTPAKSLFSQPRRPFSSGCVRLEHPFALADYLMQGDPNWNAARVQAILDSGKTVYVHAPKALPIFITYLTAWVDANGALNFRDDIYGRDNPTATNNDNQATKEERL